MRFNYKAQDQNGNIVEDHTNAVDKFELAKNLKEKDLSLISAEEAGHYKGLKGLYKKMSETGTVPKKIKITFGKSLASMLEAGLSLSRSLSVMERQMKNPKFRKILKELNESIKKGDTLGSALEKNPKIFSNLFISMVKAGEESGDLVNSLKVVSMQMEESYKLNKKIQGAMLYPGVIITAMIGIGIFLLTFVVPTLTKTFTEIGVELPASTQMIISISDVFKNHTLLLIVSFLAFVALIFFGVKTSGGKKAIEWFILHLPVIGTIVKQSNSARTARTLSSLLASGVPYLHAVNITQEVVQNSFYKNVLEDAKKNIELGKPVSEVFESNQHLYPIFVTEMTTVGEETGDLGSMFLKVAIFYEDEISEKTKNLSTIIEPILMVIIGAAVGFFAVSMISPMYSLVEEL